MPSGDNGFTLSFEETSADEVIKYGQAWEAAFNSPGAPTGEAAKENLLILRDKMNELYPYVGQMVFMSGLGIRMDKDNYLSPKQTIKREEGVLGEHRGFTVQSVIHKGKPAKIKLMHKLIVIDESSANPNYEFMGLDSSILSVDMVDRLFYRESRAGDEEAFDLLIRRSLSMSNWVNSEVFRRLDREVQAKEVDRFVNETEQDTGIRGSNLEVRTRYGYLLMQELRPYLMSLNLFDVIVEGECLGLDSLESLGLKSRPIKSRDDMLDSRSGLCMVMDPEPATRANMHLREDQLLYLPVFPTTNIRNIEHV